MDAVKEDESAFLGVRLDLQNALYIVVLKALLFLVRTIVQFLNAVRVDGGRQKLDSFWVFRLGIERNRL